MSMDLEHILAGWPHEPGQIKVRRISGDDGREKVQLRLDLGLIQMNVDGRPDGRKPHGYESLLDYHKTKAEEAEAMGREYRLDAETCGELQQEGIQYYHRYISLFQLGDFRGVVRDTARNLELFAFVKKYAPDEEIARSMQQFRPYVLMMNTRARASIELSRDDLAAALRQIERGRRKILEVFEEAGNAEAAANSPEIQFLEDWHDDLVAKRPLSDLDRLRQEMDEAVRTEAYERAAELRDRIRAAEAGKQAK